MEPLYTISRDGMSIEEFTPQEPECNAREAFILKFAIHIAIGRIEENMKSFSSSQSSKLSDQLKKYRDQLKKIRDVK